MTNKKKKLIVSIFIPVIVFLFNILLLVFGVYNFLPWFDIPMHFIGGMSIAYFFICLVRFFENRISFNSRFFEVLAVISFVSLVAVFWEFYEFFVSYFLPNYFSTPQIGDTLLDLFLGILGAFFIGLFVRIREQ